MSTLTWLHLSDFHLRETHAFDANIVLKALLKDIDERIEEDGLQPAFIACTGDIAYGGKATEYELASSRYKTIGSGVPPPDTAANQPSRGGKKPHNGAQSTPKWGSPRVLYRKLAREFFDKLLAATGVLPECLFIIPGNHDADRGMVGDDVKALANAFDSRTNANALFANTAIRRQVLQRLDGYAAFANEYFPKGHLPFDDDRYFFVQSFKDEGTGKAVAILGLNSAWLAYGDEQDRGRTLVGEWQVRAALDDEKVRGADVRVALLHHPFV